MGVSGLLPQARTKEDVFDGPASADDVDACVVIFGVGDGDGPADGFEGCAAVDGVAAGTHADAPFLATDLHDAVVILQHGPRSLLHPCLFRRGAEVLRCLKDGSVGVGHHVRDRLEEELRTGAEVRIEDGEELAGGLREGVTQITRFLEFWAIRSNHVGEAESLRHVLNRLVGAIMEDKY